MQSNPVYLFKQAASFGPGLSYSKGVHRVPESVLRHAYFQKLLKAGHVVEASKGAGGGAHGAVPVQKPVDAQKRAVEASQAEAKRKLEAMKKEDEAAAEDAGEDEEEEPSKDKGKDKSKKK